MSLSTYSDLKASVASWANRTDLASQIPDFVAWAHEEIGRRLRAPVLYTRADVSVNAETVAAPTDFLAAKQFYLDLTPRRTLRLTDAGTLIEMTSNLVAGDYPTHFAVEGASTLAFAPLFSGSATGKLLYYAAPATLSADSDTNVVLAKYPFLYLYGSLEALFRYLADDSNTDRYGNLFGALIDSINAEEAKDAFRGPLQGAPSGAVV